VAVETPSLEELSPGLFALLTRPERALARLAFSQELKQVTHPSGTNLRRMAGRAYTSALRSLVGLVGFLLVGGVVMVIAGRDNHVPVVEPLGMAIVAVWAVFCVLLMLRAVQVTRYCNRNLGGYT
jgi:hypothetical protein